MNGDADDDEADYGEDSQDDELAIEERPWAAGEIAEQIQILSDAADLDWREELALAIQSLEHVDKEHLEQIDEARRHVLRNLVLDERTVNRLALYERHIMAQFKSTYSLLERARALQRVKRLFLEPSALGEFPFRFSLSSRAMASRIASLVRVDRLKESRSDSGGS